MSLEQNILDLTIAVHQLTAALGRMQAPGPLTDAEVTIKPAKKPVVSVEKKPDATQISAGSTSTEAPNDQPLSTDTTSGEPSAPTGESSSPALDYVKDVKPVTIQLSREKGREITIGVLSRFGVKSAQDLDPKQWADYIAHCQSVLKGGEV